MRSIIFKPWRAVMAALWACALCFVALTISAPRLAYAEGPVYGLWLDADNGSAAGELVACDSSGKQIEGPAPAWSAVTDLFVGRETVPAYAFMWKMNGDPGVDYVEAPNVTSITCLDSCTTLEECAFWPTADEDEGYYSLDKVEHLTLSKNTVNVDNRTLSTMSDGVSVGVAEGNPHFVMGGDALYRVINDADLTIYPDFIVDDGLIEAGKGQVELVLWNSATGSISAEAFHENTVSIAPYAMCGTAATSIALPNTVLCVGTYAFSDSSQLTSLSIPASVKLLAYDYYDRGDAYWSAGNVADGSTRVRFDVDDENKSYMDFNGALYDGSGMTLLNWQHASGEVAVPDGVRAVGVVAFRGSGVTKVTLPMSVERVCNMAFSDCAQLSVINIMNPAGLSAQELTNQSFGYGQTITINVPPSAYDVSVDRIVYPGDPSTEHLTINALHSYARLVSFQNDEYELVACDEDGAILEGGETPDPQTVTDLFIGCDIPDYAFMWTFPGNKSTLPSVDTIVLTEGCTAIGTDAFSWDEDVRNCVPHLSTIRFEANPSLVLRSFTGIRPVSFEVGEGCTAYAAENGALLTADKTELINWTSAVGSVTLPVSVKTVWPFAMYRSEASAITVPEGVVSIGQSAFGTCAQLASISLPASVVDLSYDMGAPEDSPYTCAGLIVAGSDAAVVTVDEDNPFVASDEKGSLYSKDRSHLLFMPATNDQIILVPEGVTHIEVSAISGEFADEVMFPSTLRYIGQAGVHDLDDVKVTFTSEEPPEFGFVAIDLAGVSEIHVPVGTKEAYSESLSQLGGELPSIIDDVEVDDPDPVPDPDPTPVPDPEPDAPVNIPETEGGAVSVDSVPVGETAIVVAEPDPGQEVREVIVTDAEGNVVDVTINDDGTYAFEMPEGGVTVRVAFGCDGGDLCETHRFGDVDQSQWYHDAVDWAIESGAMSGYADRDEFGPEDTLTRAQLAAIAFNLAGKPQVEGSADFSDLEDGAWYANPVAWAVQKGLFSGYDDSDLFGPNDGLTREQAAVVLMRWAELMGLDTSARVDLSAYPDAADTSGWAEDALSWAVASGVLNGFEAEDGTRSLAPQVVCSRAQIAALLMNWFENIGQ